MSARAVEAVRVLLEEALRAEPEEARRLVSDARRELLSARLVEPEEAPGTEQVVALWSEGEPLMGRVAEVCSGESSAAIVSACLAVAALHALRADLGVQFIPYARVQELMVAAFRANPRRNPAWAWMVEEQVAVEAVFTPRGDGET